MTEPRNDLPPAFTLFDVINLAAQMAGIVAGLRLGWIHGSFFLGLVGLSSTGCCGGCSCLGWLSCYVTFLTGSCKDPKSMSPPPQLRWRR
jgi:hypothetical protein